MNRNFRSLWNDTTGTYVAVSENTKSQGKKTMSSPFASVVGERLALKTISVCIALCFGVAATAGPVGGVVAVGTASINTGASEHHHQPVVPKYGDQLAELQHRGGSNRAICAAQQQLGGAQPRAGQ
jgi:hypothetical protein